MLWVRAYRPDDASTLVALFRETVRRVNRRDYSGDQVRVWAPDEIDVEAWGRRFGGGKTLVAISDGQVVGFADWAEDGHVDLLYVHADHQRRGVGRALMAAIEAEAHRLAVGRLTTEASLTARPFFEGLGFIATRRQTVLCRGVEFLNDTMEKDFRSV